jgi:hypothetical protein
MLKQKAVYWPPQSSESSGDDFDDFGQPLVSLDPIEIDCRWEDVSQEFIAANGTNQVSRALVYVGQDVTVGGILMLGELVDIIDPVNIKTNPNTWEIKRFDKLPNLKNTKYLRTAYL